MLNIVISAQSFSLQTIGLSVHSPSTLRPVPRIVVVVNVNLITNCWRLTSWLVLNIIECPNFKFHEDWSSGTLSRLTPSSIQELDSWVTYGFGNVLDMVGIHQECYGDAPCQISLRSVIRNPIKMTPSSILELDPWRMRSTLMGILVFRIHWNCHEEARV